MSLFDRLSARALGETKVIEPIVEPSPLGPAPIGPTREASGFDELDVERPVGAPAPRPTPARTPAATSPPAAPAPRLHAPTPTPISERRDEPPRTEGGSNPAAPARVAPGPRPTTASGDERRADPIVASVTVVERQLERTRELIRELPAPARLEAPAAAPPSPQTPARSRGPTPTPTKRVSDTRRTKVSSPAMPVAREPGPRAPELEGRRSRLPRPRATVPEPRADAPLTSLESSPAPVVQVLIGRVIVRADAPQRSGAARPSPSTARPTTSLAAYLAERERGER